MKNILSGRLSRVLQKSQAHRQVNFERNKSFRLFGSAPESLGKKTALYDFHVENGGKMVPYAGYNLPVQYGTGVKTEHLKVRSECGLFDVSHMGQIFLYGKDRAKFVEKLTPVDISLLEDYQASLSVILTKEGGIIDDTVVTRMPERIEMVLNGACKDKDIAHINEMLEESKDLDVKMVHETEKSLLALQGPKAMEILQRYTDIDLSKLPFMYACSKAVDIAGSVCEITRCGYTGEDGFEISIHNAADGPAKVAQELLSAGNVTLAGLGARDSLRVEAGLCLYGNDIDDSRSVVEAGLLWVISKQRRAAIKSFLEEKTAQTDPTFLGYERVMKEIASKPAVKRAGILVNGAPARDNVELFDEAGDQKIGVVTSGTFSPVLGKPIAMGYIKRNIKLGTKIKAKVRNKMVDAQVTKMPFVPANYYRP